MAYQIDLLSVLLLSDLGCAFLVLVGGHDLLLEFFEFVRLGADALDLLALAFVVDLEVGHLAGERILDLRLVGGLELPSLSQSHFVNKIN